jgi:hypothetical protein
MAARSTPPKQLRIDPLQHPDHAARRAGFDLDDPYVEQVWVGLLGPSGILLLRRLPLLWREATPAHVEVADFAASLGLNHGLASWNGRIWRTFKRLAAHRLATPLNAGSVGVFVKVPPVTDRQLTRLPGWATRTHDRLLGDHLTRLSIEPQVSREPAARITARLDHMQQRPGHEPAPAPGAAL